MYKIKIDTLTYYYDDLPEVCNKMCEYLDIFNLVDHAHEGEFKKTGMYFTTPKVKKYELKLSTSPPIYIEI